jgi:hypothetical protein
MNTPCCQSSASRTSGTTLARRPPMRIASITTPRGSSHSSAMQGAWSARTVKRAFGCALLRPESGVHSWPCQSIACAGGCSVIPSHHTSPSTHAQLVNTVSCSIAAIALGLES